jgi:outer membrane protein assembly factor BamB
MSTPVHRLLLAAVIVAPAILPVPTRADCDDCGDRGCHAGTPADEFIADRAGLIREWIVRLPFDSTRGQLRHVTIGDGIVVASAEDGTMHAIATGRGPAGAAGSPTADAAPGDTPAAGRDGEGDAAAAPPLPHPPAPGSVLWSTKVGGIGGALLPAGIGGKTVAVGGDLGLVALEADGGGIRWREPVGTPTATAAPIGESIYVPLSGGRLHRSLANPLRDAATKQPASAPAQAGRGDDGAGTRRPRPGRKAAAAQARLVTDRQLPVSVDAGGRVDRPVMPFGDGIAWTTTNGLLIALERTNAGWDRYEFDLLARPTDTPIVRGTSIFAATVAGDLARVDFSTGGPRGLRTGWHVVLDGTPDAGPFLGGNTIVVSLGDDGLAAFTADTGSPVWRSPVAGRVLAVGGDRVWLIDHVGRLSAIDVATGERRARFCLGCLTMPIVNVVNDRLFLASADGLLVCLAPKRPIPDAFPAPTPVKKPKPRPAPAPASEDADAPAGEAPAAEPPAEDADDR